jgi:hypothetical protein
MFENPGESGRYRMTGRLRTGRGVRTGKTKNKNLRQGKGGKKTHWYDLTRRTGNGQTKKNAGINTRGIMR